MRPSGRTPDTLRDVTITPGFAHHAEGSVLIRMGGTEVLCAASVFVEYEPQTRIEGDLQQMPSDFRVTELWQVLTHAAPGRTSATEVTVFDSVGFALEDYSALRYMRDAALALGLGQQVSLIPALNDPKDLFSLIQPSSHLDAAKVLAQAA